MPTFSGASQSPNSEDRKRWKEANDKYEAKRRSRMTAEECRSEDEQKEQDRTCSDYRFYLND